MDICEKKSKIVWLQPNTSSKIAQALGVTVQTVSKAANGHMDSELAKKIRRVALAEYGAMLVVSEGQWVANVDSSFDADGVMTQEITDRVKIVVDFKKGIAGAYVDGELKMKANPTSIPDFMEFQRMVVCSANELN